MTTVSSGGAVSAPVPSPEVDPKLSGRALREHLRRSRQRVRTLLDRIDLAVAERAVLRQEMRHLRAENQRLVRLARTYQQQAGMTPEGEGT